MSADAWHPATWIVKDQTGFTIFSGKDEGSMCERSDGIWLSLGCHSFGFKSSYNFCYSVQNDVKETSGRIKPFNLDYLVKKKR